MAKMDSGSGVRCFRGGSDRARPPRVAQRETCTLARCARKLHLRRSCSRCRLGGEGGRTTAEPATWRRRNSTSRRLLGVVVRRRRPSSALLRSKGRAPGALEVLSGLAEGLTAPFENRVLTAMTNLVGSSQTDTEKHVHTGAFWSGSRCP